MLLYVWTGKWDGVTKRMVIQLVVKKVTKKGKQNDFQGWKKKHGLHQWGWLCNMGWWNRNVVMMKERNVENRVDAKLHKQFELIGNLVDALGDLEGPAKPFGQLLEEWACTKRWR